MKIKGNTVGFPNPQPDWNQTDPTQADYVKNKPPIRVTGGYTEIDGLPAVTGIRVHKFGEDVIIINTTYANGSTSASSIKVDENNYPVRINVDNNIFDIEWQTEL